eukprot:736429-Hanusia_phi.AAC.3
MAGAGVAAIMVAIFKFCERDRERTVLRIMSEPSQDGWRMQTSAHSVSPALPSWIWFHRPELAPLI